MNGKTIGMTTEFIYLTFSVFEISDFNLFIETVKVIFKKELRAGKAEIYSEIPNPSGWVNPQSGGSHFPKFSCWQNKIYPDKVFFISNYEDGLSNVCRIIQKHLRCNIITCALSNETETDNPFFKFYFSNSNLEERLIQAYKEDRWIFYEEGKLLSFENLDYYKRRRITDRLNNNIIKEYMIRLGIDINTIDAQIKAGIVYVRK